MGVCCNVIAAEDPACTCHHVAIVYLGLQLQGIEDWDNKRIQNNTDLYGWRVLAVREGIHYIHIPVNLSNTHWVIFCVDLDKKSFWWGQSMYSTCSHLLEERNLLHIRIALIW